MKKHLRQLLEQRNANEISDLARRKRRVLGVLTSLTYDADPEIGWRAVEAMGLAARRIAEDAPDVVRNHLRRLYWLISEESGGQCWHAPEAMAEIIRHTPELSADYTPIVVFLIQEMAEEDLERFRPGTLWAIGRLADVAGEHIPDVLPAVIRALDEADPQARGMAVWCLDRVGGAQHVADRPGLLEDQGPVDLYEDGRLIRTSVGALARRTRASS